MKMLRMLRVALYMETCVQDTGLHFCYGPPPLVPFVQLVTFIHVRIDEQAITVHSIRVLCYAISRDPSVVDVKQTLEPVATPDLDVAIQE
jgi:hypothetical protein